MMTEQGRALHCARCQTALPENSRFCLQCGTPVAAAATPEATPVVAARQPAAEPVVPLRELLQQELGGEIALGEELSRGPLTVAFSGVESRGQREVVVHVVPPGLARSERGVVDRLLRAARSTATLRHPCISPVLRVAAGDRLAWYVARREEGESLQDLLEREWQLPLERVVAILGHIATALGCAHEHGVVHGAITPASVMVTADDQVTVRDFGIACASRISVTPAGTDSGGYNYQAPELDAAAAANPLVAAGIAGLAAPASAAADQYALAVIGYQMLTGNLPFMGSTPEAVRHEHQVAMVPPLGVSRPDLPVALSTVLERALSKNPADRFPSVTRLAAAFRLAAQGRTSPTQGVSGRSRDTLFFPEPAGSMRPGAMRNALAACAAAALLVVVAWQVRHPAWSTDTVNGRLVAPMPDRQETVTAYGRSEPVRDFPPPDRRPAAAEQPAAAPAARRDGNDRVAEADGRSGPAGVAFITLGTNPVSTIFINGVAAATNPVRNWTVPSGRVYLRFESTDTGGVVVRDTTVIVNAGESLNLGFVRLGSQP